MALKEDFEAFWYAYPKKKSKLDAFKAYEIARRTADADTILNAVLRAAQTYDWQKEGRQYVPYPATWLRAGGWMDEIDDAPEPYEWKCPHTPHCLGRNDCDVLVRLGR